MDWKSFIASMIDSLAWPAVVCYTVWLFHEKLGALLPRLTKLKHNDTELEFSEGVRELEEQVSQPIELPEPTVQSSDLSEQFDFLQKLAHISPRAAILEAWRNVETSAAKAAAKAYPELEPRNLRGPARPMRLLEGKVLSKEELRQISGLRRLRNMAAHHDEFDLGGHPIEAYIDIALSMVKRLEDYDP